MNSRVNDTANGSASWKSQAAEITEAEHKELNEGNLETSTIRIQHMVKHASIHIIRVPEREGKRAENVFEDSIAENLIKETDI